MQFIFNICPSRELPKYIETKVQTICLYLMQNFFDKKEVWN